MKESDAANIQPGAMIRANFKIGKRYTFPNHYYDGPAVMFNEGDCGLVISVEESTARNGKLARLVNVTQNRVVEDLIEQPRLQHCFSMIKL